MIVFDTVFVLKDGQFYILDKRGQMHLNSSEAYSVLILFFLSVAFDNDETFLIFFLWLPQDSTIFVLPSDVTIPLLLILERKKCVLVTHHCIINHLWTSWLRTRNIVLFLSLEIDELNLSVFAWVFSCSGNQECRARII